MKKLLLLFGIVLFFNINALIAQKSKAVDAIKNAPFILDGTTCGKKYLKNIDGKDYVSYPIVVHSVLKGNKSIKQGDTIELISEMPFDWNFIDDSSVYSPVELNPVNWINGIKLGGKTRGVYFLKKETFQGRPVFGLYLNKNDGYFRITWLNKYNKETKEIYYQNDVYGFSLSFDGVALFNDFLKNNGLEEIKENPLEYSKKKEDVYSAEINHLKNENTDSISIIQAKRKANYNTSIDFILNKKRKVDSVFHVKSTESIDIEIKNELVNYDSTENADFYEFDIYVKGGSSNTYIDNLTFVIGYNINAFNSNIVGTQGISIVSATGFNTTTYNDPMDELSDESQGDSFSFIVGTLWTANTWNRVQLTTIPQKLVHIKMKISSCHNYTSNTQFLDINNVSITDIYANNATISPFELEYLAYDANYIQPSPFKLCSSLQITDFYPKTISSGTESVLTITGTGFGANRDNAQVIFKSSKDGGLTEVPYLNDYDYSIGSWSDTLIEIVLPYSVKDKLFDLEYTLGSGTIKITKGNETTTSTSELNIIFANDNYNVPSSDPTNVLAKIPFRQVTFSGSPYNYINGHSREFYLDTSISNNPMMEAIIKKALRDWSCETGINWIIVGITENRGYIEDGKSVIFLDDALIGDTIGLTKLTGISACYDNSSGESKRFMYAKEIDMGFSRIPDNKNWALDTIMSHNITGNKYDFYEVVMHELGHAHYLGHINKESDIMFYASDSNPAVANRKHIFTSPPSIEGGNYIMDKSLSIVLDECENTNTSTSYHPSYCGTMSITSLTDDSFDITAFPNPFYSSVIIRFNNSEIVEDGVFGYTLTDISGKLLMISSCKGLKDEEIDLFHLNSGIYLLNITNEDKIHKTIKLIKQ